MSFNNKNNKNSNNNSNKKYCKVCHDAGKSESEYTSHFTRASPEPNSKVICPTLLSLECRYCSKKGHTVKYCKTLEKDKKASFRQKEEQKEKSNTTTVTTNKSNNMFDNLDDYDDDLDDDFDEEIRYPEPVLKTSYASILLSQPSVSEPVKTKPLQKLEAKTEAKEIKKPNNVFEIIDNNYCLKYPGSWADTDTESETDEDEDENEVCDANW